MKNTYIFLEDKLSVKLFKFLLFISIIIFSSKNVYAISGTEINNYIKIWLASEGLRSSPEFSKKKILPNCDEDISYKKHFNNFKLIKVSCEGKQAWTIFVKTNVNAIKEKKLKLNNHNQIIVLNKSIEKGKYITKNDLIYVKSSKRNIFFTDKEELIGRKVKQNLRKGQFIQPRHLFEKYSVNEGDPVFIVSKFKNAIVSTRGFAVKSGNIGDLIEVKNERSGKIIKGILKKNKKINVFF